MSSATRRAEAEQRFADVLRRSRKRGGKPHLSPDRKASTEDDEATSRLRHLSQWFRPEPPAGGAGTIAVTPPLRIAPHQRVLVATGTAPQARIEIAAGSLAGSQIHLVAHGQRIEATFLTGSETSRQTLIAAMDAVRERLRARALRIAGPTAGRRNQSREEKKRAEGEP